MSFRPIALLLVFVLALIGAPGTLDSLFTLSEDGGTFTYRARPGDHPSAVARMFGLSQADLPAFLELNGIKNPSEVPVGHVYRIPNPVALRADRAEQRAALAERDISEVRMRSDAFEAELAQLRLSEAEATRRAAELAWFEEAQPVAYAVGAMLLLGIAATTALAGFAVTRERQSRLYGAGLANDLDARRRAMLAERQEAARQILNLTDKVRVLEERLVVGGRAHPAPVQIHDRH